MLKRRLASIILIAVSGILTGCMIGIKQELTAGDIPITMGSRFESYVNQQEVPVDVSFRLEGPWDFTRGPSDGVVKSQIVALDSVPYYRRYPDAKVVEKVLPTDYTLGFTAHNYIKETDDGVFIYGQSTYPTGDFAEPLVYDEPERLLKFPLRVGDAWTDKLKIEGEARISQVVVKTVVARGQVVVPAGTFFNCFMIRIVRTVEAEQGADTRTIMYIWWAPDVGPVAVINSQTDELDLAFGTANYFSRLKSYSIAK